MNPLADPSNRRLLAMVAGVVATVGNRKLGLDLEPDQVLELLTFLGGYIVASNAKAIAEARAAGVVAATAVKTLPDVVASQQANPPPPVSP